MEGVGKCWVNTLLSYLSEKVLEWTGSEVEARAIHGVWTRIRAYARL
jgi:hypothetical protein